MILPSVYLVYNRRHTASSTKKATIDVGLTFQRKTRFISSGVRVFPNQWDARLNRVINTMSANELNDRLEELLKRINCIINEISKKNEAYSHEKLIHKLTQSESENEMVCDFIARRVEERGDIRESTKKHHRTLVRVLEEFDKIKYMSDLNKANIIYFDDYLHNKGIGQGTISNYHKWLKVYINEAIRLEIIRDSPYIGFKIDRGSSSSRRFLHPEELRKVEECKIPKALERVRDLFLFQCYTGLAYADLMSFDFNEVHEEHGQYVVTSRRVKTESEFTLVLLSPAMTILKKYDYQLPKMSNQQYNLRLHIIETYAGLDAAITSHVGRHTFATWALSQGISIEIVSKMLGHSDIKTTQIYAKILAEDVKQSFLELEKKLNKK